MRKVKVRFLPEDRTIWVRVGENLHEALLIAGYAVDSPCAGWGLCGKCKIKLQPPLPTALEITTQELKHLTLDEIQQGYRLACQVILNRDAEVWVPAGWQEQLQKNIHVTGSVVGQAFPLNPAVRKVYLELPLPTLQDRLADWERLERGLLARQHLFRPEMRERGLHLDSDLLGSLPGVMRRGDYRITAVLYEETLIAAEEGNTTALAYGVSFDLGTTTMVGTIHDLNTGRQLASYSRSNPQQVYGADVLSRISFVSRSAGKLLELQSRIVNAVNEIIEQLAVAAGVRSEHIYEATVVGNTVIHHLFLGLDPTYLGQGPYIPVVTGPVRVKARRLGITMCDTGYLYLVPNVAGFIGGDAVGVILSTGLYQSAESRLAVDIGTNGEIILGSAEEIWACSTAAGPAFEGARIKHGMRATAGAIESVIIEDQTGNLVLGVIGEEAPRGISGSGLIDIVAELLRVGVIDYSGRLLAGEDLPPTVAAAIASRVRENEGRREFVIVAADDQRGQAEIVINQEDIRELQLAKGAIAAGIQVLKKERGITAGQIAEIYLAGSFGSSINPASARAIGLIPGLPIERIVAVGNAAGAGAQLVLLSRSARRQAEGIAREVNYVELSGRSDFQEAFLAAMYFPKPNSKG